MGKGHDHNPDRVIRAESYSTTIILVADLPDNRSIRILGTSDLEDVYNLAANGQTSWCQVSTYGKPAAIYSDLSDLDENSPFGLYPTIKTMGDLPSLPEDVDDTREYRKITFVGINDESDP